MLVLQSTISSLVPSATLGGAYSLRKWPVLISTWRWKILVIFCIIGGGCSSTVFGGGVPSFWGSRPELWVVLIWGLCEASEDHIHHQGLCTLSLIQLSQLAVLNPTCIFCSYLILGCRKTKLQLLMSFDSEGYGYLFRWVFYLSTYTPYIYLNIPII